MTYTLRIDGEPVGKGRPRFSRFGQPYTPEKTRENSRLIMNQWREKYGNAVLSGPVQVSICAGYGIAKSDSKTMRKLKINGDIPCLKKPDVDNVLKQILDSVPWENGDQQVVCENVIKYWDEQPHVIAVFRELGRR